MRGAKTAKMAMVGFLAMATLVLFFFANSDAQNPGIFIVTNLNDGGPGSLREALADANARAGRDFIKFAVSGTIPVSTNLVFSDQAGVVLDGFSAPEPGIRLDFSAGCSQLLIQSSKNKVRGLKVNGLCGSELGGGIHLFGSFGAFVVERNVIEGNSVTNSRFAIVIDQASSNVIRDNVLVGNGRGIWVTQVIPNNDNVIENNLIGNNSGGGIVVNEGARTIVRFNHVGLDAAGNPMPNGGVDCSTGFCFEGRIRFNDPGGSGSTVGPHNVVAFNLGPGVVVGNVTRITITRNSIFDTGGINFENLTSNENIAAPTILQTNPISGTAPPNSIVEIFLTGTGNEGRFFVGSVKADPFGSFASGFVLTGLAGNVTATATDANGNTSRFSAPVPVP